MPVQDALALFKKEHIRRAPVIKNGKMVGIVSDKDLLNASPSPVTSLSVWEINYLISKIKVSEVMTRKVVSVKTDTPIEEAARVMADNKFGGLPVVDDGHVVGIITETDLFKMLLELMGAREQGVRITAQVADNPGELARVTRAIADAGGSFLAFGQFTGPDTGSKLVTFKVSGIKKEAAKKALEGVVQKFYDIRQS
jgi:acetoin utilization protein AcuB